MVDSTCHFSQKGPKLSTREVLREDTRKNRIQNINVECNRPKTRPKKHKAEGFWRYESILRH